jgi:C-terminal processing protease CtpA/Prc
VVEDAPAEKAGIRPGARIAAVDGEPVDGMTQLQGLTASDRTGVPVVSTVLRTDQLLRLELVPVEAPAY